MEQSTRGFNKLSESSSKFKNTGIIDEYLKEKKLLRQKWEEEIQKLIPQLTLEGNKDETLHESILFRLHSMELLIREFRQLLQHKVSYESNLPWGGTVQKFIEQCRFETEDKSKFLTGFKQPESELMPTLEKMLEGWLSYAPITGRGNRFHSNKGREYIVSINSHHDAFKLDLDLYLTDINNFFKNSFDWKSLSRNLYESHIRILFHLHAERFGAKEVIGEKFTCKTGTVYHSSRGSMGAMDLYIPNAYVIELKLFKDDVSFENGLDTSNQYTSVRRLVSEALEQAKSCFGFSDLNRSDELKIPRVGVCVTRKGIYYQVATRGYYTDNPELIEVLTQKSKYFLCWLNSEENEQIKQILKENEKLFERIDELRIDSNILTTYLTLDKEESFLNILKLFPQGIKILPTNHTLEEIKEYNRPYSYKQKKNSNSLQTYGFYASQSV